jgi:hypothetical protein
MTADGEIPLQRKLRRDLRVRARDPFAEAFAGVLLVVRYVSGGAGNQSVHCPHCGLMLTIGQDAHGHRRLATTGTNGSGGPHCLWLARSQDAAKFSFPSVAVEIEREYAFMVCRPLQDFGMAQRAHGVVITGAPVLAHARTRELEVL